GALRSRKRPVEGVARSRRAAEALRGVRGRPGHGLAQRLGGQRPGAVRSGAGDVRGLRVSHHGGGGPPDPRPSGRGVGCRVRCRQARGVEAAVSGTRVPGDRLRGEILRFLEDTAGRTNWAHKGLRAALRGLRLDEALWKPERGHSVWEQINHIAYWKRYILHRTQGKPTRARQAWPAPGRTAAELNRSIADLGALHRELRAAVTGLDPETFDPKGG